MIDERTMAHWQMAVFYEICSGANPYDVLGLPVSDYSNDAKIEAAHRHLSARVDGDPALVNRAYEFAMRWALVLRGELDP